MECSEPGVIRDEELVAYVDGEKVRPVVLAHLVHCQRCSSQVAAYRRMDLKLLSKLYRWDCPSNQILGEYQLDLLSAGRTAAVKSHLASCVLCAAEMRTLANFLTNDPFLVERAPLAQEKGAPAATNNHHPVAGVKRALEGLRDQTTEGARRIVATFLPPQPRLVFQRDSAPQVVAWPRRYAAEDVNISLQIERGSDHRGSLQLLGFVTREGQTLEALQGVPVQLSSSAPTTAQTGSTVYTQRVDDLGNFVFAPLIPATYTLELRLPDGVVIIDELPVTAQD